MGIGGGIGIGGPAPRVAGPKAAGATVGGSVRSGRLQRGRIACVAGRVMLRTEAAGCQVAIASTSQWRPTRTKGPHGLSRPLQPGTATFSYHTRVPYGPQAPEALLNPIAAGMQGGLRLCHRGIGQQHPGLRLTVGLQHNQGALQRLVAESPPGLVISERTGTRGVWPSG